MKAAAPQPSPPLPKAAVSPLTPVLAETPPIEELDEEKTKQHDAGMQDLLAERALRPARPKASVNTGYADLVGAAQNPRAASSQDVGASSGSAGQLEAAPSSGHQQHTLARVVRSSVHTEPTQSIQFKLATELVRDEDEEEERESAVQRKWDPSLAGDAPIPPDHDEELQRKDTGASASAPAGTTREIHAIARAGVERASEPLPHLDRIQPLFAPHDLSGVRTVTGGAAAEANARLGALGYTVGERIAFRAEPDVQLAAHEAAHVVQQRSVGSSRGISTERQSLEREADAVAARAADAVPSKTAPSSGTTKTGGDSNSDAVQLSGDNAGGSNESPTEQRGADSNSETPVDITEAAQVNDVSGVVKAIRPLTGDIEALKAQRDRFNVTVGQQLERWLLARRGGATLMSNLSKLGMLVSPVASTIATTALNVFAKPTETAASAEEGLRLVWKAIPLMERLMIYDEGYRELEQAQLDVIRNATPIELQELANDSRLEHFYEYLSPKEEYDARRIIAPTQRYEATLKLIDRRPGTVMTDSDLIATAIFDLSSQERSRVFNDRLVTLQHQLGETKFGLVAKMVYGTEADALSARLALATEGLDDEAGIDAVVQRTATLTRQYRYLRALLQDPNATEEDKQKAQTRLAELGDIPGLVALPEQGQPVEGTFMGALLEADEGKFASRALTIGADPFQVAKQRILLAASWSGVDEQAIKTALIDLNAPVRFEPGEQATPEKAAKRQQEANSQLRQALLKDPEVRKVLEQLRHQPQSAAYLYDIEALASGDRFNELAQLFTAAVNAGNDAQVFQVALEIASNPEWRRRYQTWAGEFASTPSRLSDERRKVVDAILNGQNEAQPDNIPVSDLLEYTGDVTTLRTVLSQISESRRNKIRLGYWISKQGKPPNGTVEIEALKEYQTLEAEIQRSQIAAPDAVAGAAQRAGLGQALASEQGVQDVLDALLGGGPTSEEAKDPAGLFRAAGIMHYQIEERLKVSRGLVAPFTETDETMDAAAREFGAIWEGVQQRGEITEDESEQLTRLFDRFMSRLQEFRGTSAIVTKIAATVAAIAASVLVIAVTGGAATPAVVALAAGASAGAGMATSEAFAGGYYDVVSEEGLKDAATFAIDGALNVLGGSLAAKGVELLGLRGGALVHGAARIAASTTGEVAQSLSRRVAVQALESAIDGALGGAGGEGLAATFDADTWRQGLAQGIGRVLKAAGKGGLIGGVTGGAFGAGTKLAGRALRNLSEVVSGLRNLRRLPNGEFVDALEHAIQSGRINVKRPSVRVLDPGDFQREFNTQSGRAVTVLEDNAPVIYVRADADPRQAMMHELTHLEQLADPLRRPDLLLLTEAQLRGWEGLSASDRLSLARIKIDVEIDAQQRLLQRLGKAEAEGEGAITKQLEEGAQRELADLKSLKSTLEAITPQQIVEMNSGVRAVPDYLQNEARLFQKGPKERLGDFPEVNAKTRKAAREVTDGSKLEEGESAFQIGDPWLERTPELSAIDGKVTSIEPNAEGGNRIAITPEEGNVRYYDIPKGGQVDVKKGRPVSRGQVLGSETREYRLVEIRKDGKAIGQRQEIHRLSGEGWVQRGSEVTARGLHTEAAGRKLIRDELEQTVAKEGAKQFRYREIDPRNGSGGFDGVFVTIRGTGKDTRVSVRIIEVKDYPGRYVPKAEFTAITDNLNANLDVVKGRLRAFAKQLNQQGDTFAADELEELIRKTDFEIELLLGEGTLIGVEGTGTSSVLSELRKEVKPKHPRLRIREGAPTTVPDKVVKATPESQPEIDQKTWGSSAP